MKKEDKASLFVKRILKITHIKVSKKLENLLIQIFKFGIVGVMATIIDFASIYILKEFLHIHVIVANTLSFCIATVYNYMASIHWVFKVNQDKDPKKNFILFIFFSVIGLILNDLLMWFTVEQFQIYYLLGKVIATCLVMIFNFITRKLFLE
ncbi:MAG: GtrA family protein [Bacilli bacterium]|nr:GtrA family protein [Bacilli bacterium]